MIVINRWYGRLGNNIIQVQNVLFVALFHCHETIKIPKHPYFNKTIIHLSVERKCLKCTLTFWSNRFFFKQDKDLSIIEPYVLKPLQMYSSDGKKITIKKRNEILKCQ
jgi:hypothetical protein